MGPKSISVPKLEIMVHNETESWRKFLRRFEIATVSRSFAEEPIPADTTEKQRVIQNRKGAALLENIGEEGMDIFETFEIEVSDINYDVE